MRDYQRKKTKYILPNAVYNKKEESEEPKETEKPEKTQSKLDPATIRGYKAGLSSDIRALERMLGDNQYRAFRTKLETMLNTVNRIIDSEEVSE